MHENAPKELQQVSAPVPLSFPAILRNPGLKDRYAHLGDLREQERASIRTNQAPSKRRNRDEREGKRWIRRRENARFSDNPHIVNPSRRDYILPQKSFRSTFPKPLPHYLSRSSRIPPPNLPSRDAVTANAGRFSLSLKGMRRDLRRHGARAEYLVRIVENEILGWLHEGGTMFAPDEQDGHLLLPGVVIGEEDTNIREVKRTPLQLVWSIADDAFARYVVHCCARFHEIVSFSKELNGQRLTYLLRPNVTRPDHSAPQALETPPITDIDYSSHADTDTDFNSEVVSDRDLLSDIDESFSQVGDVMGGLRGVPEGESLPGTPPPESPLLPPSGPLSEDGWSVLRDSDYGGELLESMEDLSLTNETDLANPVLRDGAVGRARRWASNRQERSASSPSPVPTRRLPMRRGLNELRIDSFVGGTKRGLFCDYLFS